MPKVDQATQDKLDLDVINKRTGAKHKTIDAALSALELGFVFAGREAHIRNLMGVGVDDVPALQNVSMSSPCHDNQARRLLVGHLASSKTPKQSVRYWKTLPAPWASKVRKQLLNYVDPVTGVAHAIPFGVELLASPEINMDGEAPLFSKGTRTAMTAPASLFQLGVLQVGERGYLRSVSAPTLMLEVWPPYWRYFHRAASSPVPDELVGGPTMGSPVLMPDGVYRRGFVMYTKSYAKYVADGYPA